MTTDIDKLAVTKVYGRWAPVYDLVFGAVFEQGRRAAIAASERVGGRILEVGVGTGISLPYYSDESRVFGIDLSEQMLRKARRRVADRHLRHVERLAVMDAERLDFPDASFDVVVAQYVVNTVPHPEAALGGVRARAEAGRRDRVAQPGRRRRRSATRIRAPVPTRRQSPRLALRISLGALRTLVRQFSLRHATDRAPPDAAARPLLADSLRQDG